MRKGFIFNHNKCVGCNACSAACILENKWTIHSRKVITFSSVALPELLITNLSIACNHCDMAVCLEGCPSSSYHREQLTGAIVIDESKCIGCKYCQWNCPYDAPQFDLEKRIIGKCNLCFSGVIKGGLPACTTACPTGALNYGELSEPVCKNIFTWFPDKNLNPAIEFKGNRNNIPLRIIPENIFDSAQPGSSVKKRNGITGNYSLVAFSFLTTLSVAMIISSLITGIFPDRILLLFLIAMAGFMSLFHLGKKLRAWRAFVNLKKSPLSREVTMFILFSLVSSCTVCYQIPQLIVVSGITGLVLLFLIDSVYIYSDDRKQVRMHSGQTFISALLIVSFISGIIMPFLFLAIIKLALSVYALSVNRKNSIPFGIRFFRIAILLVTGASIISEISYPDPAIISLFLTGEFLDRVIFYVDFKPLNINSLINH